MDKKEYDLEVPVVIDRREFFEQEAMFAVEEEAVETYLGPEDPAEELKKMREEAEKRTS